MSAAGVLDLWSDDIRENVLTPVAVLRMQVSALSQKAKGILRAEVRTEINQQSVGHYLVLIAPGLKNYQAVLLKTWHDAELVYPATVKSRALLPSRGIIAAMPPFGGLESSAKPLPDERIAETQDLFVDIVREVLQSGWVRSLMQSLIARTNDAADEASSETEDQNGPNDAAQE